MDIHYIYYYYSFIYYFCAKNCFLDLNIFVVIVNHIDA